MSSITTQSTFSSCHPQSVTTQTQNTQNNLSNSQNQNPSLSILFFGTNQYYETPQELVRKFTSTNDEVMNVKDTKERKLFFDYKIGSKPSPTNVKFIFLNILDQEYTICKKADAYVVFVDLESIDSLDKLNNILTYIKESCRSIITIHIFGKYENSEDRIKSLSYDKMNEFLKEKNIVYNYQEMRTGEGCDIEVSDAIKTMLQLASDSQERIRKLKIPDDANTPNKVKTSEEDISKSICIVF